MIKKFSEYTNEGLFTTPDDLSPMHEDNKWVSTRTDKYASEESSKNINDMEPEEFYQYIKNHYEGIPSKYFKDHRTTSIDYFDNKRGTKFIFLHCCEIKDNDMVTILYLSIIYHNLDVYVTIDKNFMNEKSFHKLIDSFKLVVGDNKDFAYGDFIVYPKKNMNTENEFALTVLNTIIENCNIPLIKKKFSEYTDEKNQ